MLDRQQANAEFKKMSPFYRDVVIPLFLNGRLEVSDFLSIW